MSDQRALDFGEWQVLDTRQNAIEPASLIGLTRSGERSAGELLGVQVVRAFLRRVLFDRQRVGTSRILSGELVAESAQILNFQAYCKYCKNRSRIVLTFKLFHSWFILSLSNC